jgi:hypothetical protein
MATQLQVNKPDWDATTNPNSYNLFSVTEGRYRVQFREDHRGYHENHSTSEGTEYTRVLGCYWNQRNAFLMDLLGTCVVNSQDGSLSRTLPEFFPGRNDFICIDAKMNRVDGKPDFNTSDEPTLITFSDLEAPYTPGTDATGGGGKGYAGDGIVWYTTTWRKPLYAVLSDAQVVALNPQPSTPELSRYVYRKPTYAGDTFPLPGGTFRWVNAPGSPPNNGIVPPNPQGSKGTPILETLSKNNLFTEYTYTWYKVPVFPRTAVLNCQGKVNSLTFDGADPQTVLFEAPDFTDPYADVLGNLFQNIMYKMRVINRTNIQKAIPGFTGGWNTLYRLTRFFEDFSQDGTMSVADGNRLYDQADLNTLFVCNP